MNNENMEKRQQIFTQVIKSGQMVMHLLEENTKKAQELQTTYLLTQMRKNAHTEYGKKYHFSEINSVDKFRAMIPLTEYKDYLPYLLRMSNDNEKDLITSYPIEYYYNSTGTTGTPKRVPGTALMARVIQNYVNAYKFGLIYKELGDIWTEGATCNLTEVRQKPTPCGILEGYLSARVISGLGDLMSVFFTSPKEAIYSQYGMDSVYLHVRYALTTPQLSEFASAFITLVLEMFRYLEANWQWIVDDIEKGVIDERVSLPPEARASVSARLEPMPERAAELRAIFAEGFETPIASRIWPNLKVISAASGSGFAPFLEKVRRYVSEDVPVFYYGYTASEGVFGIPYKLNSAEYVMIPDSCFYEFEPVDGEPDTTVLLHELEVGKEYKLIITNQSFYRYRVNDVIRVVGYMNQTPIVEFLHRGAHITSVFGEKTTETLLVNAVHAAEKALNVDIVDFSAYSDFYGEKHGRYAFLIELGADQPDVDIPTLVQAIQDGLSERSAQLKDGFKRGWIDAPTVRYLRKGTYQEYREMAGAKNGNGKNQVKPIRILNEEEKRAWFLDRLA